MPAPDTLCLFCPAKINLTLAVGPAMAPHGRHPLVSWMLPVAFGDTLHLTRQPENLSSHRAEGQTASSLSLQLSYAADAPRPEPITWQPQQDLVTRAHHALEAETGRKLPVRANVIKRVPTGAGLGGGSGDAAGMLVGLNQLFDLTLDTATLCRVAGSFSSDAVFQTASLHGRLGTALVHGLGERLEPLPPRTLHLALLLPPFGCNTAAVYAAFDALAPAQMPDLADVRHRITTWPGPQPSLPGTLRSNLPGNDLLPAACRVQPELARVIERVATATGLILQLTGSGAALFVLCPDAAAAQAAADQLQKVTGWPALATWTCPTSP